MDTLGDNINSLVEVVNVKLILEPQAVSSVEGSIIHCPYFEGFPIGGLL